MSEFGGCPDCIAEDSCCVGCAQESIFRMKNSVIIDDYKLKIEKLQAENAELLDEVDHLQRVVIELRIIVAGIASGIEVEPSLAQAVLDRWARIEKN